MEKGASGSRITGFSRLGQRERLATLAPAQGCRIGGAALAPGPPLSFDVADHMIENAVGVFALPFGVGLNFQVNGRDHIVPMAVEEPSVVAAACRAARVARAAGGFVAEADPAVMIGQIQLARRARPRRGARRASRRRAPRLLARPTRCIPNLVRRGGGARDVEVRDLPDDALRADGRRAPARRRRRRHGRQHRQHAGRGARARWSRSSPGGEARLRILSNLADRRLARARGAHPVRRASPRPALDGGGGRPAHRDASALAAADPYRAATHNKGIMNGIDAVAIATGNDWRGIEAGAHAYAARDGALRPALPPGRSTARRCAARSSCRWRSAPSAGLELNPRARLALRVLGRLESARELAAVMAAVGLAQNLAALRALATEGIQRGHMALHARARQALRARVRG